MARKSRKSQVAAHTLPQEPVGLKVWLTALYIRLSVEDKGNHGISLETQQRIMENYASLHPDIQIVDIFCDNGVTGTTFQRPAFQKMLEAVEDGRVNCIMVKDLSRLGRNVIDSGYYLEKYFPMHHVRFISVNDQYDSNDQQSGSSAMTLNLKSIVNEAYALDISRKIRAQANQSMKAGEFIGSRPPYGYQKDPDNCHKLVVDEEAAAIVRDIFNMAANGDSLDKIVLTLNEKGIPAPGKHGTEKGWITNEKLSGRGFWSAWSVNRILTREVYVGDMVQGKTKTINHKQVKVSPDEWIIVRGTHEPLISRELFDHVQGVLKNRRKHASAVPYTENILRGKVFCGHCGRPLNRRRDTKYDQYYLYCYSKYRYTKDFCDGSTYVKEDSVLQTLLTIIQKEAAAVLKKQTLLQKRDTKKEQKESETTSQLSQLHQRISLDQSFLKSLYQNFVTGILTANEYRTMKEDYEKEINAALAEIHGLEDSQKELEQQKAQLSDLADRLQNIQSDTSLSAALIDQLIDRIAVYNDGRLDVDFRFRDAFKRPHEVTRDE